MIACFLSNNSAEYYKNPSMLSRVIAKNVGDVFLRHSVQQQHQQQQQRRHQQQPTFAEEAEFGSVYLHRLIAWARQSTTL